MRDMHWKVYREDWNAREIIEFDVFDHAGFAEDVRKAYKRHRNDFEAFAEWALEEGYADGLQLDRIDNDGDYCPENCRWVTRKENCRNTRRNKYLTLCGVRKTVAEWCETLDISEYTLYYWIREHGEKGCEKRVYERLASEL